MTYHEIDDINLNKIYPGDTLILKICKKEMVTNLINFAEKINCKLISLNYGQFYFKEYRSVLRNETIDNILKDGK